MNNRGLKYVAAIGVAILFFEMVFALPLRSAGEGTIVSPTHYYHSDSTAQLRAKDARSTTPVKTSKPVQSNGRRDLLQPPADKAITDSDGNIILDSLQQDTIPSDTTKYNNFLDEIISGKNSDSLVYMPGKRLVYIYKDGDVTYGKTNMKADFMRITMDTKELYAHGFTDTLGVKTQPELTEGASTYKMDTVTYNIKTQKAKIKGVATQEGEGFLYGYNVKKMKDNAIHIRGGRYTTCDDPDCPHFYLQFTKGKVIPNDKVIVGFSYLVFEGVPTPFFIPEGFFPLIQGRRSGFIIPSYGEEMRKGFYLQNGGYYLTLGEHADLTLTGGIYTKGSWYLQAKSSYIKRYKFRGNLGMRYSIDVLGDKGLADYQKTKNFKLDWSHQQDPKANPGSTFNASVNFQTSGYAKNSATTLQDALNQNTNSSISYSKSWLGTPFSISSNMQLSQSSRDTTYSIGLPNVVMNMSRINPFKRKNASGKERWYEKITMSYTGNISNSVRVKEYDFLEDKMFEDMKTGVKHSIPVQTSFNLFNYINVSPNANYTERWYFKKINKEWDSDNNKQVISDTTHGFYRVYDYNFSLSATTKVYGTYLFKNPKSFLQAIRHTLSPTVGMGFTPDFSKAKYGFYKPIQTSQDGQIGMYSPFEGSQYGVPGRGRNASLTFSLTQTLEAKVLSKTDTSGMKKVKIIDNFSISGSYNFLADSMKLSNLNLGLRMTIPGLENFGLNLNATLDPYVVVNDKGRPLRINKLRFPGRIINTGWSTGYTFNGGKSDRPAMNNQAGQSINPFYFDPDDPIDPILRRQMMVSTYYDFSIPWNLGFNYSVNYTHDGLKSKTTQTLGLSGSVTLTKNFGINITSGYDFEMNRLTSTMFTLTRDLHCWQFNFNWVPLGRYKQWSFNISAKSALLQDLKYDQSSSHYDTMYDDL